MTDRQQVKRVNTEFERRQKLKQDQTYAIPNLPKTLSPSAEQRSLEDQIQEFTLHSQQGHLLLAVTLVTLIPDDDRGIAYGETEDFRSLWDKFLLQAFAAHLPKRKRHYIISSVYHIHHSPTLHFHGIIAIPQELAHLVWKDGEIKKAISRTFKSWRKNEKNTRPTTVRNVHISRIANIQDQLTQPYSRYGGEAVRDWLEYAAGKKPNSKIAKYLRSSKTLTKVSDKNGESLLLHSSSQ